MATLERLTPGQIVWSVRGQQMGNTTARYKALYRIVIKEIDLEKRQVLASWNNNAPRWFPERHVSNWRVKKPEPKGLILGMPTY